MTVGHKFQDEPVKNKAQICETALSQGEGGMGGGRKRRCMLKKSTSHSFCLVTKFGFNHLILALSDQ
jgi:hypothetical protein